MEQKTKKMVPKNNLLWVSVLWTTLLFTGCSGQDVRTVATDFDWAMETKSLTQSFLDQVCSQPISAITRKQKDAQNPCNRYFLNGALFSGWACAELEGQHKFRYEQFDRGIMIRRIAYYDNGQIDADFRMKNCENYGPSRMWLYDGSLYIDEFYIEPGIKDGIQKQYHANGLLARESVYKQGQLVSEQRFDFNGKRINP